jgi:hypothetical protein
MEAANTAMRQLVLPLMFLSVAIFAAPGLTRAAETTAPLNPQTYFAINGVGFYHRPDQGDELRRRWELMAELGMKWDRSDLWWSDVEREPGKWDFSKPDTGMEMYRSHGVQMLPILDYGARWRQTAAPGNDAEREEWARYVSRMVARYNGFADTWEVWNEPNILPFWRPQPDTASYAKLLEVTADKARAANPKVRLCAFASAGADIPFIERVIELAGTDDFDLASYHFYRAGRPEERTLQEADEVRLALRRFGKVCPVWVTEMGVTSHFNEGASEEAQAAYWMRQMALLISAGIERIFPFTLVDNVSDPGGDWGTQLGMVTLAPEWRKKPVFGAYQTMVRELQDWEFVGTVFIGDDAHGLLFKPRGAKSGQRDRKLVAWSTRDLRDIKFVVDDGAPAQFTEYTTLHGAKKRVEYGGGVARVAISPEIAYIPTRSSALDNNASLRWRGNPVLLSPGERHHPEMDGGPAGDAPGQPYYTLPAGWQRTPGPQFGFVVPADAEPGWCEVLAHVPESSGTLTKALRVWVRKAVEADLRPAFTSVTDEFRTGVVVHNVNAGRRVEWRLEGPGDLLRRVVGATSGAFTGPCAELDFSIPANAVRSLRHPAFIELFWRSDDFPAWRTAARCQIGLTPYAGRAPAVDGDLHEFESAPAFKVGAKRQLIAGKPREGDTGSADVRCVWTDSGLFVGADIKDDRPMMNQYGLGGDVYRGDCVELYIGLGGYSGQVLYDKPRGDFHFAISPGVLGRGAGVSDFQKEVPGSRVALRPGPAGCRMEAFIPREAFNGAWPRNGDIIGFDVQFADRDDFSTGAESVVYMWNGDGMNWLKPLKWGIAVVR